MLAAFTDDLVRRGLNAGDLVKHVAPIVHGGGGGPPTMAQAGGKDASRIPAALAAGRDWIRQKLQG
jgi:alanyl-tRNA synthetase